MIRKTDKENKNFPFYLPAILIVLILGIVFLFSFLLKKVVYHQRVQPGTKICGENFSGMKKETAILLINQKILSDKPQKLILKHQETVYPVEITSLNYNPENTVLKAINQEKKQSSFAYLKDFILILKNGKELDFDFSFDNHGLEESIASISAQLFIPAINPEIKVINEQSLKSIQVENAKIGQEVDQRKLKKDVLKNLSCPQKEIVVEIPINIVSPDISEENILLTKKRAELLLDKKIILKLDNQSWEVNDEEIISFLDFSGDIDETKINEFAKSLSLAVNSEPENAAFNFENNRVTLFKPSKDGITLNQESFLNLFKEKIILLQAGEENLEMQIPVSKAHPDIATQDINSLGIKELIAKGESLFYGSIQERIHNINLASLKLNGILIPPGETFSFNKAIGDISTATGYKQAYIIKNGRTVLGDGGGVCQVSTTLFRAALNAGLLIKERYAHAYRVHYYEEDLGPGFDSTVFNPTADLKFENNTPSHVLIQMKIDIPKRKLAFELYGTKDNRIVEISKARVWDKTPPPPDLYQDDPTLPLGTIKQVDWKAWGAKTAFDYKISLNGETLQEKTFYSNYKPWQAVFLRGTGE